MSKIKNLVVVGLAAWASAGCWEQVHPQWFDQMKDGPAVQALENAPPREPPEGTVPVQGYAVRIVAADPGFEMPMQAPKAKGIANPIEATAASIERGKQVYASYCQVCHGIDGMSIPGPDQPVTLKLMTSGAVIFPLAGIPAYTDGMVFTKITYGKPSMPGYPQILPEDRWHVINYLRTLIKGA